MAEIVKITKDGVIQYPITKPEAVIDENGKNVLQLIRENSGGIVLDKEMSNTSTNGVENQVIKEYVDYYNNNAANIKPYRLHSYHLPFYKYILHIDDDSFIEETITNYFTEEQLEENIQVIAQIKKDYGDKAFQNKSLYLDLEGNKIYTYYDNENTELKGVYISRSNGDVSCGILIDNSGLCCDMVIATTNIPIELFLMQDTINNESIGLLCVAMIMSQLQYFGDIVSIPVFHYQEKNLGEVENIIYNADNAIIITNEHVILIDYSNRTCDVAKRDDDGKLTISNLPNDPKNKVIKAYLANFSDKYSEDYIDVRYIGYAIAGVKPYRENNKFAGFIDHSETSNSLFLEVFKFDENDVPYRFETINLGNGVVDSELLISSANPVQNKVITEELNKKASKSYVDDAIKLAIQTALNTNI